MSAKKRIHLPTIVDVARKAGVSVSTVSRVLNGTAAVVPETEERVRAAIAEMNFVPRLAAQQLAKRQTRAIGMLLPEISGAFFSPMLRGVEAAARENGYSLLIYATQNLSDQSTSNRPVGEHNTDGLLVFAGSILENDLIRLHRLGFPVVLLHQTPKEGINIPVITIENKTGAIKLVSHLIEVHQRRRIVYLQGPDNHEDSAWRERGYIEALKTFNIPFDPSLIVEGGFDEEEAYASIQQMILDGVEFDAIFAGDDDAATGVLRALAEAGIGVPEQVAVVGFDDVPFARFLYPPLTTVRAPIEEVGRKAVEQLVLLIKGSPVEHEVLFPTELVVRKSCGCNAGS